MSNRARAQLVDLSAQKKKNASKKKAPASASRRTYSRASTSRRAPSARRQDQDFQFMRKQAARKARVRRNRLVLLLGFLIVIGAVFAIRMVVTLGVGEDAFYAGVRIDGLDLEGMTRQEATAKLAQLNYQRLNDIELKLTFEDQEWSISGEALGAHLDIEEQVELAWQQGREGNLFKRQADISALRSLPYSTATTLNYDRAKLEAQLAAIKEKIDIPARDASIDFDPARDEKFRPINEVYGREVDLDMLIATAVDQLDRGIFAPIKVTTTSVTPKVLRDDLVANIGRIKRATTTLGNSKAERIHNIKLVLSMFNGMVIQPGQEVSFNETTGPRGLEQGYQNAGVIVDDEITDGPGGGVCQVSTTLYQALVRSGLQIVSRVKHSLPVSYVPVGTDAAVAYDYLDLVFKNNTDAPIYLICEVVGSEVSITVHGRPLEEGVEIKIVNDIYETIPAPEPEIVQDVKGEHVIYSDETKEVKRSREGYKVRTYAVWYKDGEETDRETLSDDYYRESQGTTYVGMTPRDVFAPATGAPSVGNEDAIDTSGSIPVIGGNQ